MLALYKCLQCLLEAAITPEVHWAKRALMAVSVLNILHPYGIEQQLRMNIKYTQMRSGQYW